MASQTCGHGGPTRDEQEYDECIERMRKDEYPMLKDAVYLDHAGTTLYSKKLMEAFHADMMSTLYGNPHSASPSSQQSTQQIENTRLELLRYFGADPEHYDLVFTANATAAIKLVMEGFRECENGFWYGYHVDSHTSLVGVRQAAVHHKCFVTDREVESWIASLASESEAGLKLLAYPAQSNMNGRRLPLAWCQELRKADAGRGLNYTLLDAAAYASTSSLDLSDLSAAPDFVALSLYKIFGFPDLGALIVRKGAEHIFRRRRYFGGGTVDMVVCVQEQWHIPKSGPLHLQLEDGTLPVHSIVALGAAMRTHREIFSTGSRVSSHTTYLAKNLHDRLSVMTHGNGGKVCHMYKHETSVYSDSSTQGPIVAFNLKDSTGNWVSNVEVEKLAAVRNIHIRTGGLCNPGGIATSIGLEPWEMRDNFSAGFRCGGELDIMNGKPTGMIRVSFGAMSAMSDVHAFLSFIEEFFVCKAVPGPRPSSPSKLECQSTSQFHIESLTVYPIKSCAGWQVPHDQPWEVRAEGLAWDREWCIVHPGTGAALSQKRYPRMALIRPHLDFKAGKLRVGVSGCSDGIEVPLSLDPSWFGNDEWHDQNASVCGDPIQARAYTSPKISDFLTRAVGVPCRLARFPAAAHVSQSVRHSKAHLPRAPKSTKNDGPRILLSNESPILTISRSSLNRLNEKIKAKGGKAAHPAVFRANIIVAESQFLPPGYEQPWVEDYWTALRIAGNQGATFDILGGCRRCQMVCVDQESGEKNEEPFVTLAKTRRFDGRVLFGVHTALARDSTMQWPRIKAGDVVEAINTCD